MAVSAGFPYLDGIGRFDAIAYGTMKKARQSNDLSYTVRFEPAEEGGYVVMVPALPGVVTDGDTLEEARARARDAIRCHLSALRNAGLPVPTEDRRTTLQQQVRVATPTA